MFDTVYAEQYETEAVIIPEGAKAADVIAFATEVDAVTYEGPDKVFVVQFPGRAIECYSSDALRCSLRPKYTRDTTATGVKVFFKTDDEVPEGLVETVGRDTPPVAGVSLSCAPLKIGGKLLEGLVVRTWRE